MQNRLKYQRQVELLVRILPYVAEQNCFALKGGTALNLFLRDLPRLSVDIDLTYLPVTDRQQALDDIDDSLNRIIHAVTQQLPSVTVTSDNPCKRYIRQSDIQVKLEVNEVLRGAVHASNVLPVSERTENDFGYVEMQVLSELDLHAGKLCAALDRQHPRDLFDMLYFFENHEYNDALIDTFIVCLISHNRPISEVLNPRHLDISQAYENEFVQMTESPVPLDTLLETRTKLISMVQTNLTEQHKQFLLSFKKRSPNWSLLGVTGIDQLPAVKWKLHNLNNMSEKKHAQALEKLQRVLNGL